jgi:hypothetical protein
MDWHMRCRTSQRKEFVSMTMVDMKCDVCGVHKAVGVCSSPFGAVSMAYCHMCLHKPAEAEWIFDYLYVEVANGDPSNLSPEINNWYTFHEGAYISWENWVALYGSKIDVAARNRETAAALERL